MRTGMRRAFLVVAAGATLTFNAAAAQDQLEPLPDHGRGYAGRPAPQKAGDHQPDCVFGQPACCNWCCAPRSYVQADVLWLAREGDEKVLAQIDVSPAVPGVQPGQAVLRSDDFDFDFAPGMRLTVGHWLDSCRAVEFTYLGLHDWDESARSIQTQNPPDPIDGEINGDINVLNLAGFFDFRDSVQVFGDYRSRLHSFELNMRRRVGPNASVLTGLRYINIDEDFHLVSIDRLNPTTRSDIGFYNVETDNHMVGPQIGGEVFQPVSDRFSVGAFGKAGLLLNFAESSREVTHDGKIVVDNNEHEVELASVVELGLIGRYALSPTCALRAGYQVVYIGGVALAVDQAPEGFETDAVWYHGPSAGFEYLW